jgi:hypothetical protein
MSHIFLSNLTKFCSNSHGSGNEGGEGCHIHRRPVEACTRGRTRETETKGGGVKVDDDGGKIDDDGLEEEDGDGVL